MSSARKSLPPESLQNTYYTILALWRLDETGRLGNGVTIDRVERDAPYSRQTLLRYVNELCKQGRLEVAREYDTAAGARATCYRPPTEDADSTRRSLRRYR